MLGAIALQGVRLAAPTLGERFVVIGLGLLGLMTVQLLRANGCRVLGVDLDAGAPGAGRARSGAETVDLGAGDGSRGRGAWPGRGGRGVDGVLITASAKSDDHRAPGRRSVPQARPHRAGGRGRAEPARAATSTRRSSPSRSPAPTAPGATTSATSRGAGLPVRLRPLDRAAQLRGGAGAAARTGSLKVGRPDHPPRTARRGGRGVPDDPAIPRPRAWSSSTRPRPSAHRRTIRPPAATRRPPPGVAGWASSARELSPRRCCCRRSRKTGARLACGGRPRTRPRRRPRRPEVRRRRRPPPTTAGCWSDPRSSAVFVLTRHDPHARAGLRGAGGRASTSSWRSRWPRRRRSWTAVLRGPRGRRRRTASSMVGFNRRFSPHAVRMRRLLAGRREPLCHDA